MKRLHDITLFLLVFLASLVVACSSDDRQDVHEPEPLPQPQPQPDEPMFSLEMAAGTRTEGDEEDEVIPPSVHVYVTTNDAATTNKFTEGDFFKTTTGWSSTASVKTGVAYYIYGFAPSDIATGSLAYLDGATDYTGGAKLTLDDMNPVANSDVGIVVGVRGISNLSEASSITANDITTGSFRYDGQNDGENFICLKLSHLYAALAIRGQVSEAYDELRTIKIKKMALKSNYTKPQAVITLTAGQGISGTINWSGFTSGNTTTAEVTIFESDETDNEAIQPITLTTSVQNICTGYLVGNQIVMLTTTYDILDKFGNTVRQNCTATNHIDLSRLPSGEKRELTLKIDPTYLYQLTEPDPDSPTIKIE